MTTTGMHTPWGCPQDIEELAEGVWRVSTAGHGGLKLSPERWEELPRLVRATFITATFAEEDCEEPIAMTLLGLGDEREREFALKVAGNFDRYSPALPCLREIAPGPHYHVIAYFGGCTTELFRRFDTRAAADAFASDAGSVREYGRMAAIECGKAHHGQEGA